MNLNKNKRNRSAKGSFGRYILDTLLPGHSEEVKRLSDSEAYSLGCNVLQKVSDAKKEKIKNSKKVVDSTLYGLMKNLHQSSKSIFNFFVDSYCEHVNNSALLNAFKEYLIDTYALDSTEDSFFDFLKFNNLSAPEVFGDLEDFLKDHNLLDDFIKEYMESLGADEDFELTDSSSFTLQNSTDLYSLLTNTPPISKDIVIELFVRNVDADSLNQFHQFVANQLNLTFDPEQKFTDFCFKNSGQVDTSHLFELLNNWLSAVDKQKLIKHIIEVYKPDNTL